MWLLHKVDWREGDSTPTESESDVVEINIFQ